MKINTVNYLISDAFKSLKRNRTISIASIITVVITFLVLGIFLLVAQNTGLLIGDLKDKIQIEVFLEKDIKPMQQTDIKVKLESQSGVQSVKYNSATDAYKKVYKENPDFLKGYTLSTNPFSASYIVKVSNANKIKKISKAVKDMPGVDTVKNQQDIVSTIQSVVRGVNLVGMGLFVILIAVSIFLIMNTTKLTVYSRRREVGIMKFVGATDWFIRWPFIIEGMVIGVVGSILSIIAIYFLYNYASNEISSMFLMMSTNLISSTYVLSTMLIEFILGGALIGGIASYLALRKFLKV